MINKSQDFEKNPKRQGLKKELKNDCYQTVNGSKIKTNFSRYCCIISQRKKEYKFLKEPSHD